MDRIWNILQTEATTDKRKIRSAYARRSREIHPEEKPEEFQELYEAYQRALQYASLDRGSAGNTEFETMRQEGPETESEVIQGPDTDIGSEATGEGKLKTEAETVRTEPGGQPAGDTVGMRDTDVKAAPGDRNIYQEFGFDSEKMREEQLRFDRIMDFQRSWNAQMAVREQGGEFLNEDWRIYLQSEEFQEIMWSPIVMDIVAKGLLKHFQWKRDVLLFFWELYGFGIFEKWGEENFEGESLQLLYRSLQPVTKRNLQNERIQNIKLFTALWQDRVNVWRGGGEFFDGPWKEYLKSDRFQEIMWSSTVLDTITIGVMKDLPRNEEIALFFWDLYGFEELGEENCEGKTLGLYKKLYPAYTNRLKRKQYVEDSEDRKKKEKNRICRMIITGVCLMLVFIALLFINVDVVLVVSGIALVSLFLYFLIRLFISV